MESNRKVSIASEVKKDIKSAQKIWLPWRIILPMILISIPIFLLFDQYGLYDAALPAMMCVAVIAFVIYVKRDLSRKSWFWATIGIFAVIHALLIFYIPWTANWVPALAVAMIGSLDLCVLLWIIAFIKRIVASG